jgi:hypothetical protein
MQKLSIKGGSIQQLKGSRSFSLTGWREKHSSISDAILECIRSRARRRRKMLFFDLTGPMPSVSALEGGWFTAIVMIGIYAFITLKGINFLADRFFKP